MRDTFHTLRHVILAGLVITCFGANSALADQVIDDIVQQFQAQCDAEQAYFLDADDDVVEPLQGHLTLAEDAIYEIELTPDGMTGTVVYNEFHCTNIGYAWCGSGGCGFHIIVDGVAYQRRTGFRPFSATTDGQTFILIPTHGSGCITSEGTGGAGVNTCYVVATWDPSARTFRSKDGEITLPPA
jgi:hypothetical protein